MPSIRTPRYHETARNGSKLPETLVGCRLLSLPIVGFSCARSRPARVLHRKHCWDILRASLGDVLSARGSVWSRAAFERWWEEEGQQAIHLDLHRTGCRNETSHRFGVNAFRVAPLLSRGALLISHRHMPLHA